MSDVELRDIVTDEDRATALAVQVGPGGDVFVASVEQSLQPFYEGYGFVPTGEIVDDEVVLRLELTAPPTGAGTLGT